MNLASSLTMAAADPASFLDSSNDLLQAAEGHRNGLAGASGIDFQYVHADMEFEGKQIKDVGVRYKGNGTWMQSQGQLKRSLKLDRRQLWSESGANFAEVLKQAVGTYHVN